MVLLNTDVGEDEDHEHVHIFLSHDCEDRLMPVALCGDMSMGHFHLEDASEAVQVLPVPTEVGREGLEKVLAYLLDEELLCGVCLDEYRQETDLLNNEFDWSGVGP